MLPKYKQWNQELFDQVNAVMNLGFLTCFSHRSERMWRWIFPLNLLMKNNMAALHEDFCHQTVETKPV